MSSELLNAMMGAQYKAKENPFGIAAQSIAGNAGNLINPYGSVGSNAAATIGAALLAGLLGGVAKSQTESDNAALTPMVGQLLSASPEERMSIAKQDSRLSPIVAALAAQEMAQKQELAQKKQELELGRDSEVAKFQALAPLQRQAKVEDVRALQPLEVDTAAKKAGAEASARARVEDSRNRGNTEIDKVADSLRKEFQGKKEVDDFRVVERTAQAMAKTLKDKGAPTDLELTRYSILILEPGMAVREGEQAAVLKSAALPEQWKGQIAKALEGQSALSDEVRDGLKRLAARAYDSTAQQYGRQRDFYVTEAKRRNIDPTRIDPMGAPLGVQDIFPGVQLEGAAPQPSATPAPGSSPTPQQLQAAGYVKVPGGWKRQ